MTAEEFKAIAECDSPIVYIRGLDTHEYIYNTTTYPPDFWRKYTPAISTAFTESDYAVRWLNKLGVFPLDENDIVIVNQEESPKEDKEAIDEFFRYLEGCDVD